MRVLLIDPPYERLIGFRSEWFPLGLACIASFLIERGYRDVGIYHAEHASDTQYKSVVKYSETFHRYKEAIESDDHLIWKEIRKKIISFQPDFVGISVLTAKVPSAFRIAAICKDIDKGIKVVCGGHHPTVRPHEMMENSDIDFVIRGEGEYTLHELVSAQDTLSIEYHTIPGLSFRSGGKVIHNEKRKMISDLEQLPLPARSKLFDIDSYSPTQLSMVMTSRGCPYNCGFCASRNMWERKVRYRSINNILEEIEGLRRKYFVKNITFMDDSFTLKPERVKELCSALIQRRTNITWSCLTRVDAISDELIYLMKKAGCKKIDIGIESGNQRVLNLVNKGITLEQIRKAVRILKQHKMYWAGFFMFGFPSETEEEVLDTVRLIKEVKPNWANISIFAPYPETSLFDLCRKKGLVDEKLNYFIYSHQSPYTCFTEKIPKKRFYSLAKYVLEEVHRYNSSYVSLARRSLTRNYHKNPRVLIEDIKKTISWLK